MNKKLCETGKGKGRKKSVCCLEVLAVAVLAVFLLPLMADATGTQVVGTSTNSALTQTWENPLGALAKSFTGPVAMALALIMIVVGVGVLMFGGDLSGWARWIAFALIAGGTLGGAGSIVQALGLTGAVV